MAKKDPRVRQGMRHLVVWIDKDLSDWIDAARDGRSLQVFVPRLLRHALAAYQYGDDESADNACDGKEAT